MSMADVLTVVLVAAGLFFFLAGTVGLLRFPDVFTRLHALTKADNLGLGLVLAGLAFQAPHPAAVAKLLLVWLLVMTSGASAGYLIARRALRNGLQPWRKS
jgi:multicomponent Na+:H+ antiporter subunit G